ncbi:MAG: PHP domain-containing protein, partial [Promethearchaeota archaeon]
MDFHQFKTRKFFPYARYPAAKKSLPDILLSTVGLNKLGLDLLATYCMKYSKNEWDLRPWMPEKLPAGAFLLDFHSHTRLSDGEGTFKSILERIARTKVLDGIAFTNHPFSLSKDRKTRIRNPKVVEQSFDSLEIVKRMKKKRQLPDSFITFPGSCEFAPKGTHEFPTKSVELIGIGLPRTFIKDNGGLKRVSQHLAEELVDKIHDAGGIAILPHPFYFVPSGLSRDLWNMVDAVESFNQ